MGTVFEEDEMATTTLNGTELYYTASGAGPSLVLVHGSWGDADNWARVVPPLSARCRVVTYDRRGHSRSGRTSAPDSVHDDVADLAALVEELDLAPAFVCGSSYGALVTLRLATSHPELVRGIAVHEPPGVPLLAEMPSTASLVGAYEEQMRPVRELLEAGDHSAAAEHFVETVALGPGQWAQLPEAVRRTFVRNAPTYLGELRDPDGLAVDLAELARCTTPALLTRGDQSPPMFAPILERIASALPYCERHVYAGAGHAPHLTHADEFTRVTMCRAVPTG
jgi:pimeloyl-ACP methyl ester carboxylesterase